MEFFCGVVSSLFELVFFCYHLLSGVGPRRGLTGDGDRDEDEEDTIRWRDVDAVVLLAPIVASTRRTVVRSSSELDGDLLVPRTGGGGEGGGLWTCRWMYPKVRSLFLRTQSGC